MGEMNSLWSLRSVLTLKGRAKPERVVCKAAVMGQEARFDPVATRKKEPRLVSNPETCELKMHLLK